MTDWLAANIALRAARDGVNEAQRRETKRLKTVGDCQCTTGHVCRRNAACPRTAHATASGS